MSSTDWRHISNGKTISSGGYADQPYVVRTDDGAWLCIVTTGSGHEGQPGQHPVSMRSTDMGETWSEPAEVEPADGPEASYSVMLKVPSGRVYALYNHNTDNVRQVANADGPGFTKRVDSLGYFVFKYSDDHGRSWSPSRFPIPQRLFEIDRKSPDEGRLLYFWNVGKPFIHDAAAYVPLCKVGGFGRGFFVRNEGVLLRSRNLPTEPDPELIEWETLPEGEVGLRTPPGGGAIAAEHSYSILSDGSLYVVYRSVDGHPVESYSRDGGRSWEEPRYKRFADGTLMKHPRAANFAWKCSNGKFLYWFHNHGGRDYADRNPVWMCGGIEVDGPNGKVIHWSQPEIVLYDDNPYVRMSYPDLVEEDGRLFVTETQKEIARVHELDSHTLDLLWNQFERCEVAEAGQIAVCRNADSLDVPELPAFGPRSHYERNKDFRASGISIDGWLTAGSDVADILNTRNDVGAGILLRTTARSGLEIVLSDGRTTNSWDTQPALLKPGMRQHFAVIVDAGPKIISFVVDGRLDDGGDWRQFGWGRFSPWLQHANGSGQGKVAPAVNPLRIYGRALLISEVIGNWRAGLTDLAGKI